MSRAFMAGTDTHVVPVTDERVVTDDQRAQWQAALDQRLAAYEARALLD